MSVDLATFVENLLASWFGSGETQISAESIQQAAADAGYNPSDVQQLDMAKVYQNACQYPGVPADYADNAGNYQGSSEFHEVVRQIQQVTEVHTTQQFIDNSTNVDNSIDLSGATVSGGLDITSNPVTADDGAVVAANGSTVNGAATGDGAEATGSGNIQHAGDGSTVIGGDNNGIANSGDNAGIVDQGVHLQGQPGVIVDPVRGLSSEFGTGLTRTEGLTAVQPPAHSPIILNTGNNATQQVAQTAGNGNQTNFGAGDNTNLPGAQLTGSTVAHDGAATLNNNDLDHSQVGASGGPQHQELHDESQHGYVQDHEVHNLPVDIHQASADLDVHHDQIPDTHHM